MGRFTIPTLPTLPPGVKPSYPVVIDWSHPLARGLEEIILFGTQDVVINGPLGVVKDSLTFDSFQGKRGKRTVPPDEAIVYDLPENDRLTFGSDEPITIIVRFVPTVDDTDTGNVFDNNIFTLGDTDSIGLSWGGASSKVVVYTSGANTGVGGFGSISINNEYVFAIVFDQPNNSLIVYEGGEVVYSNNSYTDNVSWSSLDNLHFGETSTGINEAGAIFIDASFYRRALSQIEIKELSRNPYQFLKPAAPQTQIITPATTPNDRVWIV